MSDEGPGGPRGRASTAFFRFPPFEFDPAAGLVYRADDETLLPPKAAHVLQLLLESAGQLVSKDDLLETIWEDAYVTESSLTDAISLLRRVLGDDTRDPTYIQTLHRRGYRFIGSVEERGASAPDAESEAPPSVEPRVPGEGGLEVGERLGNYEILGTLGAGAMGTVYRARDTTLEREVAIKLLREDLARDPERLARLEREAKLLASVSHPNIAAIHSLEEADGIRFPVLELVEGRTLEERLRAGRIGVDESLEIARQIASALDAAHQRGIIHRDLKPANIKITPEGQVKVLDFGLAKGLEVMSFADNAADSPTASMTIKGTGRGSIVGTAAYMSPEQARGQDVDRRADIWSFGCVLYEMLTGNKPFAGETLTDTLAAILDNEPDFDVLPASTPRLARYLVRRCLRKEPERRLHDIADARIEIEDSLSGEVEAGTALPLGGDVTVETPGRPFSLAMAATVVVIGLLSGLAGWTLKQAPAPRPGVVQQFKEPITSTDSARIPGAGLLPGRVATISPDGRFIAYVANEGEGWKMYLRGIDQDSATPIDQVESAFDPVFSPDSRWIAYGRPDWVGDRGVWKIPVGGGSPSRLLDRFATLTWGADDTIILQRGRSLWRASALGGEPEPVCAPDQDGEISAYRHPDLLPGGRAVLAEIRRSGGVETAGIAVVVLETCVATTVAEQGTDPLYAASGHILYARDGSIEAIPFDAERLEVLGTAVRVRRGIRVGLGGRAQYSVSRNGTLVYHGGGEGGDAEYRRRLAWLDRRGTPTLVDERVRGFGAVRLSPDGKQIAVEIYENGGASIWIYVIESGTLDSLTNVDYCAGPLWTPSGGRVLFNCNQARGAAGVASSKVYWRSADFSDEREELKDVRGGSFPISWSSDGELVFHENIQGEPRRRILVMAMGEDRTPYSPLDDSGQYDQRSPMVSPDGRWLAYVESESGQDQAYVRRFPGAGPRFAISSGTGFSPMWGRDESELFYRSDQGMMVAHIESEPEFRVLDRELLFPNKGQFIFGSRARTVYDYDRVNDRFLVALDANEQDSEFTVVVNWFEDLKRLAPPGR